MKFDLVLYSDLPPTLIAYQRCLAAQAAAARERHLEFVAYCEGLADRVFDDLPDQVRRIKELKNTINNLVRGSPQTEPLGPTRITDLNPELTSAQTQALKKAWRYAASVLHPDRGGDVEQFLYARRLYMSADLHELTDFVMAVTARPSIEVLMYYTNAVNKAAILTEAYKSKSIDYAVATAYTSQSKDAAKSMGEFILKAHILTLEKQLRQVL